MTCIAAISENGSTWMGADSASISGWDLHCRKDPKVFQPKHSPWFLIGFSGGPRARDVIRYQVECREREANEDQHDYLSGMYCRELRKALKEAGCLKIDDGVEEMDGTLLIAYEGELFTVYASFQVGHMAERYAAVGCGENFALGCLFATETEAPPTGLRAAFQERSPDYKFPLDRLRQALETAEKFSAGVRGPFVFETQEYRP
jgi:ATP-dependent protease HslVU (ClpYQ) peptidase subunit